MSEAVPGRRSRRCEGLDGAPSTPSPLASCERRPGTASEEAPPTGAPAAPPPPGPDRRGRRRRLAAFGVVAVLLAADLARPPEAQLTARAALGALAAYQATLSPLFGAAGLECRFQPTCSRYAVAAVREDGALVGSLRAAGRVMRCGPWTPAGTVDPP